MSLSKLYTYWQGNGTLTSNLPTIYFGYVPANVSGASPTYPYGVITVISSVPEYTTAPHIEAFHFQITIYHTSLTTLESLADTIAAQFDEVRLDATTLICTRQNRFSQAQAVNNVYTYFVILDYLWSYNAN